MFVATSMRRRKISTTVTFYFRLMSGFWSVVTLTGEKEVGED